MYFPVTANPIGFNHFAVIEWILRCNPQTAEVVLVLSNGHHPDPTKPDAELGPHQRLELARLAVDAIADPEQSYLARQAGLAGDALHLVPARIRLSTSEFSHDRAVTTAETVRLVQAELGTHPGERLPWVIGSDLLRRMCDPAIFPDDQLAHLAASCAYHVLQREGDHIGKVLATLERDRGTSLDCTVYPVKDMPPWLGGFLGLSSTHIRRAAESGDPLGGLLPQPAATLIARQGYYQPGRPHARLATVSGEGRELALLSRLEWDRHAMQIALAHQARALVNQYTHAPGGAQTLALLETSTGGLITALLGAVPGASRVLLQSRFAYDQHSKEKLLDGPMPTAGAVSEDAVVALAHALRQESGADVVLAESGMAGPPNPERRSLKSGLCWIAVESAAGVHTHQIHLDPFLDRRSHQMAFAQEALQLLAALDY